jgi:hypothetical protein
LFADELVVSALVDVLKPSPTADVKDQEMTEIGKARPDVLNQLG